MGLAAAATEMGRAAVATEMGRAIGTGAAGMGLAAATEMGRAAGERQGVDGRRTGGLRQGARHVDDRRRWS
jgi:hypothetical protein